MGRKRTRDFDLKPGWRRVKGRLYYQPTTESGRRKHKNALFTIPEGPMVYFIRAKGGPIKIGYTNSKRGLSQRLHMLRVGSPAELTLEGAVPGSREDERRAHEALRFWRRSGEWFGPSRAATSYMRAAIQQRRIPGEMNKSEKTGKIGALEVVDPSDSFVTPG
jgi:hypothetical protein